MKRLFEQTLHIMLFTLLFGGACIGLFIMVMIFAYIIEFILTIAGVL